MKKALRLTFVSIMIILSTVVPATAAPTGWQKVDVTLHAEQTQALFLISGELPEDAKLPFEGELAVPAGTEVVWVGEILGGDPSKDPEVKYTKTTKGDLDIYRFTMKTARIVQIEGTLPNVITFDGTNYTTAAKWKVWQPVPEVRMSQRLPQGAKVVQPAEGASVEAGESGYSYYTKTIKKPKVGDTLDLSFSYALGAAPAAAGTTPTTGGNNTPLVIIALVVLIGGFLAAVNINKKMVAAKAANAPQTDGKPAPKASAKRVEAQTAFVEDDEMLEADEDEEDDSYDEDEELSEAAPRRSLKPLLPMFLVIAVFVAGFVIAGNKGTSASVVNGRISRNFGSTSACQSTSVPYTVNEGVDLATSGDQLLKAFEGMEGVGEVSIDLAQSKIDMAWCISSQTEEAMRLALMSTGMVTLGQSVPAAGSAAPTTTVQ